MSRISLFFLGTPAFAASVLDTLADNPAFDIKLVISQPDKPVGRKQIVEPTPVKKSALDKGLRVFQPENINAELEEFLKNEHIPRPDFLVTAAYGKILKQHVLDIPLIAPVNVHASLLPRWRGASPIEHAVLAGDSVTGVSIQRMVLGMDEGPVLDEDRTEIGDRETALALRGRLAEMAGPLLVRTLKNPIIETPQEENQATYCGKLSREDGNVNPQEETAEEIDRKVRALVPWPGVRCMTEGQELKLLETSLSPSAVSIPLPCADGTLLHLVSVQPAGKKPMSGKDWRNGQRNNG